MELPKLCRDCIYFDAMDDEGAGECKLDTVELRDKFGHAYTAPRLVWESDTCEQWHGGEQ